MNRQQDAFGLMLIDRHRGRDFGPEIYERDDGWITPGPGAALYFAPFESWPVSERRSARLIRGRTLDVGAGAGRVALHLQKKGFDVLAIDTSPGAIRVCRERGVNSTRVASFLDLPAGIGIFSTVVAYGNTFGIVGSPTRLKRILKRLERMTTLDARILAGMRDPYQTNIPEHLAYHRRMRSRGKPSGQIRMRTRYRMSATPFFDYLMLSRKELDETLDGTGWRVSHFYQADDHGNYVAAIARL